MATPEGKVKAWLKPALRKMLPGVYLYSPPGGMFGVTGTPDLFGLWGGVFFAIEVKANFGDTPTELQMNRLKIIAGQGGVAASMCGKDIAKLNLIVKTVIQKAEKYAQSSI